MMSDLSREPDKSMLGLRHLLAVTARLGDYGYCILLERGSQAGDPTGVALEGAAEDELLRHICCWWSVEKLSQLLCSWGIGSGERLAVAKLCLVCRQI